MVQPTTNSSATATLSRNIVRSSRFRHVYGEPAKRNECYENINITRSAHDSNFCAVNPKFLAFVIECVGGGAFAVLPLHLTGRLNSSQVPTCNGHRAPCTDLKWNPFNDNVLASASEDGSVKVWYIPDDLTSSAASQRLNSGAISLFEPPSVSATAVNSKKTAATNTVLSSLQALVTLEGHSRRILYIEWHPTTSDILVSVGADYLVILWDVGAQSAVRVIDSHPDTIYSIAWNWYGSTLATTCKDKQLRLIEPRSNNVIGSTQCHAGPKATKCLQMGRKDDQQILTTGFSRYSDREFAIWDVRMLNINDSSADSDTSNALRIQTIDSSSGIVMPYYDADLSMLYIAGKGDGTIRYYEIGVQDPHTAHYLSQYQTSAPQRSLGVMPKRGLDTSKCEIWRFYKLHAAKNLIEPISMIVPRRTMPVGVFSTAKTSTSLNSSSTSALWSDDLYPPTPGPTAALAADEWIAGRDETPVLISLKPSKNTGGSTATCSAPRNPIAATLLGENISCKSSTPSAPSSASTGGGASSSPPSANGAELGGIPMFSSPFGGAFNNPFLLMPSSSLPSKNTKINLMNTTNKPIFRREGTAESFMTTCDPNQERKFKWLVDTKAPDYRAAAAAVEKKDDDEEESAWAPSIVVKSPEPSELHAAAEVKTNDDDVHSQSGSAYTLTKAVVENENSPPTTAPNLFAASPPPVDINNTTMDFDYLQGQHLSAPPRIGDDVYGNSDEFVLRRDSWCMGGHGGAAVDLQQTSSVSPSRTFIKTDAVVMPPDSTTQTLQKNRLSKNLSVEKTAKKSSSKKHSVEDEPPSVGATSTTDGDINSKFSFTNDAVLLVGNNGPSTPSEATPSPTQALVCGFDYIVDAEQQQFRQQAAVLAAKISAAQANTTNTTGAAELTQIIKRLCHATSNNSSESPPITTSRNTDLNSDDENIEEFDAEYHDENVVHPPIVSALSNKIQRQLARIHELRSCLKEREQYIVQLETIIRCFGAAASANNNNTVANTSNNDNNDDDAGVESLIDAVRRYTDSAIGNAK